MWRSRELREVVLSDRPVVKARADRANRPMVVVALFVLADLSEDSRGDPYLTRAIPWDLVAGSVLSVLVLAIDAMVRGMKRPLG
jgi:hypothetical protein